MRKLAVSLVLLTILVTTLSAGAMAAPPATPPYYSVSDFLATTPSIEAGAAGGMFNPAAWGISPFGGLGFYWNNLDNTSYGDRNWTLVTNGFSMQRWDYWTGTEWRKFDDYKIGFGAGDRSDRFGISYGWSKGDVVTSRPRSNLLTIGNLGRPNKYISYGAAASMTLVKDAAYSGLVDFGYRPFGTPFVTLFGDAGMGSKDQLKDVQWGLGAAVEPMPGLAINFKAAEGGVYHIGLSLTAAGVTASATPHYDKKGNELYKTYGVSIAKPQTGDLMYKAISLAPKKITQQQFVKIDFDSDVRYQRYEFFDDGGHTLMELLETLELVKNDPLTGGLVLKITEDVSGTYEMLWEVREKIKEVQASGKKVIVFFERGGMQGYYLASVADKIMVDPETVVMLPGFNLGRSYYKGTLEKLGVGFDEWRFFKYKSAMEGYSRTSMSDGDREQRLALATGFYETYRGDVCASRGLTKEQFDSLIDNVVAFSADSLITYKLADTTGRWDDMEKYLESVTGSPKKIADTEMLEVMKPESRIWGEPPQIAVIYALGPCSMNDGINARRLQGVIKSARENDHIKAVVFRADSPGGDILPSDIVAVELKKTAEKKPVIVTQGQVAGSGGYWISMYGDKIVASPWTITGSIGVIGGWFYNNGFNEKLGMNYDHVQIGRHADLGAGAALPLIGLGIPERNLTADERDRMQKQILLWYDVFVTKVAKGRKLEKEKVAELAQGHVYTGTTGKEIGLVDELGGMEKAISMAREAAKITPGAEVTIREMPTLGQFNFGLLQPKLLGLTLGSFGTATGKSDPELDYMKAVLKADGKPLVMVPPEYMPEAK